MFNLNKIASGLTLAIGAHGIGMIAQYGTIFTLGPLGVSPLFSVPLSIIIHEVVETAVSAPSIIAVYTQDGFIFACYKILEPIYENPIQVVYVGISSYTAEKLGSARLLSGHSHDAQCHDHHHHDIKGILIEGTLSALGAFIGTITYPYLANTANFIFGETEDIPQNDF